MTNDDDKVWEPGDAEIISELRRIAEHLDGCRKQLVPEWFSLVADRLESTAAVLAGMENMHRFDLETIRVGKQANESQATEIESLRQQLAATEEYK